MSARIVPGVVYARGTGLAVALAAPDADGDVRFAPLDPADAPTGPGRAALGPLDFASGELDGAVARLDKVSLAPEAEAGREVARLTREALARLQRLFVLSGVGDFYATAHAPGPFAAGHSPVPVSGRCFGAEEVETLVDASLDFWLTTGRYNDAFEGLFAEYLGLPHVLTTNSGSSANLLAVTALTSPKLGDRRLVPGDEVLTVASGFPTTVNPIVQNGLVPVFVDADIPTYNVDADRLEAAVSPRTRAVVLAHTLGNPFDLDAVLEVVRRHDLWLVEDCCDALGSRYVSRRGHGQGLVGTFGHIATFSFYPAHHITMGEGGAVATADPALKKILESFRDWGRDCWCAPGRDNTCGCRWQWQLGDLPKGYDHKYVYSHLGYNLKITDMQAAVGVAQMQRLPGFIRRRRRNFELLARGLAPLRHVLELPRATPGGEPSWFGYPISLRQDSGLDRERLLQALNARRIGTRLLFAGNLVRQPYMRGRDFRVSGTLERADRIMRQTFWIGLYPALTEEHLAYAAATLAELVEGGTCRVA